MVDAVLTDYRIKSLNMKNDIKHQGDIKLNNTFDFKVSYAKNYEFAVAELTEHMSSVDEGNGEFNISLCIEGQFHMEGVNNNDTKKEAHAQCYKQLFPYASQIISQLAANGGIHGLRIKEIPINADNVSFVGNQQNKDGKMIQFPEPK